VHLESGLSDTHLDACINVDTSAHAQPDTSLHAHCEPGAFTIGDIELRSAADCFATSVPDTAAHVSSRVQ
jgi:hypothetical protein